MGRELNNETIFQKLKGQHSLKENRKTIHQELSQRVMVLKAKFKKR